MSAISKSTRPAHAGMCRTTMAWEQRGNRSYYYRSVRVGTRVTKEYAGGGLMGTLAEQFEAERREQRAYEQAHAARERQLWAELERPTGELDDLVDLLLGAV